MCLYAEAWNFRSLLHRPQNNSLPEYYRQPAKHLYDQWIDQENDVTLRGCQYIPPPKTLSLIDYLHLLASLIIDTHEIRHVWLDSVSSFIAFLRQKIPPDQQGELEIIFPREREIRRDRSFAKINNELKEVPRTYIVRKIENTVYPIDILATSDIIRHLLKHVLEGKPNAQYSAIEALAFAWLCHAISSARIMTRLDLVFSTSLTSLKASDPATPKKPFQPEYFIGIRTLFGIVDIPISKTLHNLLIALPRPSSSDHIFTTPFRTLRRALQTKGVAVSNRARNLGKITFLTFLSQPHEAIGHRPAPIKKSSGKNCH